MRKTRKHVLERLATFAICTVLLSSGGTAWAVEVGQPAPGFNLPATTGVNVSLNDFRGKSWVLIEFYGADFAPT
ncbi:MAG: redoxin domain-containing protein [Betaproteobacteria bacterium]|nr:redoxin domain-containing protein [Betaproteobacteria bacterium]